jgi:hypothetical protein
MKLYYFTDSLSAEQKATYTIESIEVDDAEHQRDKFGIYYTLGKAGKVPWGGLFQEEHIKCAVESIDVTQISPSTVGTPKWGLNLNTMKFDYVGHFENFDADVFDETTESEEAYVLFVSEDDLLHFQQMTLP